MPYQRKSSAIVFIVVLVLLMAFLAYDARAQVTQAKFDSAVARIEFLEKFVGTKYVGKSSSELAAALVPASTLPGGRYPIFLSDYQIRVGLEAFATSAQLQQVASRVLTLESQPSGGNVVASGDVAAVSDNVGGGHFASLGSASLTLKANTLKQPTQGGITSTYCGYINQNGWDGGLRFQQNMIGQPSRCAPELPGGQFGGDSRFTWSYYQDPDDATLPSLAANARYGQSLIIDGGFAQAGYSYVTGAQLPLGVLLAAQRGGQSLYFGVTPQREVGQYPQNKVALAVRADGSPSPVQVTASGQEGRIGVCPLDGVRYLCLLNPISMQPREAKRGTKPRAAAQKDPAVIKLAHPLGTLPEDSKKR